MLWQLEECLGVIYDILDKRWRDGMVGDVKESRLCACGMEFGGEGI